MNYNHLLQAVIALAIAFMLAWILILITSDVQSESEPLPPSVYDQQMIELDKEAVAEAYRRHTMQLFDGWMRDPTGQPKRLIGGIAKSRKAFIEAMTVLDKGAKR